MAKIKQNTDNTKRLPELAVHLFVGVLLFLGVWLRLELLVDDALPRPL